MARGTQLSELVYQLRAEVGHSVLVSAGVSELPGLQQKLKRAQIMLYDDYDWPFLRIKRKIDMAAGQRYYDLPSDMDMERIEDVWMELSGIVYKVKRGVDKEQYAQYNSEADERTEPLLRWDIDRQATDNEQIEAWPIPSGNDQDLWFKGIKQLRLLVQDDDVADLDDIAIVLTAAAEILARAKQADASDVRNAAAARLKQLKARTKGSSRVFTMGTSKTVNADERSGSRIVISQS